MMRPSPTDSAATARLSFVIIPGDKSAVQDLWAFKAEFPERWAGFLREHFGWDSMASVRVSAFFSVTEKTSRDWLAGVTGARGAHVAIAYTAWPESARAHLSGAAA